MENNQYFNINELESIVKKKSIKPLKRYIKKYLKTLESNNKNVSIETINLLKQANYTIQNISRLLKCNELVDSATLMRSSIEKIMMAMMIYFDPDNTYNEFKSLKKCGKGVYTKPNTILKNFETKLKEINPFLFGELTDEEVKMLLEEIYEKMCLYTHSSIAVSLMIEIKKNKDEDLFIAFFYQIIYFLELLLYCCLKFLIKDKKEHIDLFCFFMVWALLFNKIDKSKLNKEYISKYKKFIYLDINKHFNDKYSGVIKQINLNLVDLKNEMIENKDLINNYFINMITDSKKGEDINGNK